MKISKRVLAAVLACLMALSMMTVAASAQGADVAEKVSQFHLKNFGRMNAGGASTYAIPEVPHTDPAKITERENNDSMGAADRLPSHHIAAGTMGSRYDSDFYRIEVTAPGLFETSMGAQSPYVYYLLRDSNGNIKSHADYVGYSEGIYYYDLSFYMNNTGTYYLEVYHDTSESCNNPVYALYFLMRPYINKYVDVQPGRFYYYPVQWADSIGITGGVDYNHFGPDVVCSRAQLITFLWRFCGTPSANSDRNPFYDVDYFDYYYDAVLWAVENRITTGLASNYFGSDEPCTRAQMVTFLWTLAGRPSPSSYHHEFYDIDYGAYYYGAVLWAVENGITRGVDRHHFNPYGYLTRAQAVTFLAQASTVN